MGRIILAISVLMFTVVNSRLMRPASTVGLDACPGLESNVESQLGPFFVALLQDIENYLEQGKPPAGIPATFRRKSADAPLDDYSTGVVIADLAGKGDRDVVVTIRAGLPMIAGSSGAFVFRGCPSGKYTIHYISTDPASDLRFNYEGVTVVPVRLLANRSTQLLVSYGRVLSGRCLDEVYMVVGQTQDSWITYLNDEVGCGSRDVTVVTRIIARDPDSTGRKGLLLSGTHWTGWGIYQFAVRPVRVYYSWQGDELQFEKRVYQSSTYRFHVLEDAQIALDSGDLKLALQDYQKAATESYLKDSISLYEFKTLHVIIGEGASLANAEKIAHQYQTAFAYFRALVLSADIRQPRQLQQLIGHIARLYPLGKPGHEFAELAVTFQDEFGKSGDKSQACQKVNALVDSRHPNLTGQNGHIGNWGDEGGFTIDTICPL